MSKYRIVSIDGGGIRGLITTVLFQRLTATPGLEKILDKADLVAGTSTGGLLSLGIAHGIDLETIRKMYVERGPTIFDDSWLDNLHDLGKLKKKVLITAFDLDNEDPDPAKRRWKPKLFHNFPGEGSDGDYSAVDVGLYTSAAPTFFPSVDGYVDGGVYASNPSVCALAQTQDKRYKPNPQIRNILLFSIGTGTSLQYIKGKSHDWGYIKWVKPLIDLMFDGTAGIADYQCTQFLGSGYHRLGPVFPPGLTIPMDGVKKIPEMIDFAESIDIDSSVEWLKKNWMTT